jgi:hypothetical protein
MDDRHCSLQKITDLEIAQRILERIGDPNRLALRIGAKNFATLPGGLQFRFKGCQLCNTVEITLAPSDLYLGTYDLEFWLVPSRQSSPPRIVAFHPDVPEHQIPATFKLVTGLEL